MEKWLKRVGLAQYGGANWDNKVAQRSGLSLEQAKQFGEADPKTTYFFYCNGTLDLSSQGKGKFQPGDAVFFSGKPWYGSALGWCDAYELVVFDSDPMVPLRNCQHVSVTGKALLEAREIDFDTGSWTTNIPYEWINSQNIQVLEKDVSDGWGQFSDKVQGQLALTSTDRKKTYGVDNYVFFANKWTLRLMSVAAVGDLPNTGRNLVIVALVGEGGKAHVRIFDNSKTKSVDKAESQLERGEILDSLKTRVRQGAAESILSKGDREKIQSITKYTISYPRKIMGAFPGKNPLPSLPYAIAEKHSAPHPVGLGIVSQAEGDISTTWSSSFKSYLQIGADPKITGNLNWCTGNFLPPGQKEFSPQAVPAFKVTFSFPGTTDQIVVEGLQATVDTGAPQLTLRLGANNPQDQAQFSRYFTDSGPAWREGQYKQDSKCLVKDVTVRIEFTGDGGSSSYTFKTSQDFNTDPPTQVIVGKWDGIVPWDGKVKPAEFPRTRINLGNTIYFYCPVYFWDISQKRVGLYFK